ncbi:DUF1541 domain-containing protein [Piscibacillus halophilus]|uniref:DUF1541 domain-containing protein n=1 Tax=Piscibacillus halophilus TaxID=571933 RepID=UPI002409F3A8|nr:DUF1541 domain-containing protein [Piscibacillus halophilus]
MTKKDMMMIMTLFIGFFVFYVFQNPHYGVLTGEEIVMNHHLDMIYHGSSEVPRELKAAEDPTYPVGSNAISQADHMGGMMDGVEVTIVGAYETTAYATTYTSTNTGITIEEHKWIVQEEFLDVGEGKLEKGTKVHTNAEHMKGMKDTIHNIDYSLSTTVYMVNFNLPNGRKVTNHKWVVEEELESLE